MTDGAYLCGYDWDFYQDNAIYTAQGSKKFFRNHNIALFFTILFALLIRIESKISGSNLPSLEEYSCWPSKNTSIKYPKLFFTLI